MSVSHCVLDMCAPEIELQCQKHKECKASVGRWEDFKKVKNGGCEVKDI